MNLNVKNEYTNILKEKSKFYNPNTGCILYIKNFPSKTATNELRDLFERFGVIENF